MNRAMIDFETLGAGTNACIVQVGACYFDENGINSTLKINFDAEDCQRNGAVIDANTVFWWLNQESEARKSIIKEPCALEFHALLKLNSFLKPADEIWSHATFDFVIITEALKRRNIKPDFSFRVARDIRTLTALCPNFDRNSVQREGTHHDALDDAIYQAKYVTAMLSMLKPS